MKEDLLKNKFQRLDVYLYKVRLFKSRSSANKACSQGYIFLNDKVAKSSSNVNIDDLIIIHGAFKIKTYKVLGFPEKNLKKSDAKLLVSFISEKEISIIC